MLYFIFFGILIAAGFVLGIMMFTKPQTFRNKWVYIISRLMIIVGVIAIMLKVMPYPQEHRNTADTGAPLEQNAQP